MDSISRALGTFAAAVALLLVSAGMAHGAVKTSHSGWQWGSPQPQGQTIRALAFRGGRGYAAGQLGTVLSSIDGGRDWAGAPTATTAELDHLSAPDEDTVVAAGGCELLRSDDAGATFRSQSWGAAGPACPAPIVGLAFPDDQTGFLVLANGAVAATADGGASWSDGASVPQTVLPEGTLDGPAAAAFTDARTGTVVTNSGRIYRTADGAETWKLVRIGSAPLRDVDFPTHAAGYAVGDGGTVLRTIDGGLSWVPAPAVTGDLASVRCGGPFTCVATTVDGSSLLRTGDGWFTSARTAAPLARRIFATAWSSGQDAVAAGEDGATLISGDGGLTWGTVGSELGQNLSRVRAFGGSLAVAGGRAGALAISRDSGATWAAAPLRTTDDVIDFSFVDDRRGFALDTGGKIYRTGDGSTWEPLGTGAGLYPQALLALRGGVVVLIGPRGAMRSTDDGDSFTRLRGRIVRRSKLFGADRGGGLLFAYGSKNMLSSADRGRTWQKVRMPRKALLAGVDFVTSRTGYALGQNGRVWMTRDRGRHWHDLGGIGSDDAVGISFSDRAHGYLVLSRWGDDSRGYLLRTSDGGRTWRPQLLTANPIAPDGIAASLTGTDFALAGQTSLLFTERGGDRGHVSRVSIAARSRVRRGARLIVSGRIRGAAPGSTVLVSRRQRGESVWDYRTATAGAGGRFRTSWKLSETAGFVAQWAGDDDQAGDGSRPLVVRAVRARRR